MVMMMDPPRLNPGADSFFSLLFRLNVKEFRFMDDYLVYSYIFNLLLLYLDQLRYLGSLPPDLGFGRTVLELWDLFVFWFYWFSLKYLQLVRLSVIALERRDDEGVTPLAGLRFNILCGISLQEMSINGSTFNATWPGFNFGLTIEVLNDMFTQFTFDPWGLSMFISGDEVEDVVV